MDSKEKEFVDFYIEVNGFATVIPYKTLEVRKITKEDCPMNIDYITKTTQRIDEDTKKVNVLISLDLKGRNKCIKFNYSSCSWKEYEQRNLFTDEELKKIFQESEPYIFEALREMIHTDTLLGGYKKSVIPPFEKLKEYRLKKN